MAERTVVTLGETLAALVEGKKYATLRDILVTMNAVDVAGIFEEMPEEKLPLLFRLLPKELAAETFVEMEPEAQELLIRGFSDHELKEVVDELYVDDAVDIVEEMPANVVKRILRQADPEMRKMINEILKYPDDCAGSIMTTEYVSLRPNMTAGEAIQRIRCTGVDKETIYTCYVTENNRKLVGMVSLRTLLFSEDEDVLENIMESNVISVNTLEDQESVAQMFTKYDFAALPVVDQENRLVGIITVDDAIDVLQEETTEDFEKMAGMAPSDKPYLRTGVFETWKSRVPWLLILMLSATLTSMVLTGYETSLAACSALIAFIPMLTGTGGNSGTQASVAVIRGLSLGEVEFSDTFRVVWKEIRVAVLCGVTLAACNFVKLMVVDRFLLHNEGVTVLVAAVICVTMVFTVLCAKAVGCLLPLLAERIHLDPAVMASPFISTVVDVVTLVLYFQVAFLASGGSAPGGFAGEGDGVQAEHRGFVNLLCNHLEADLLIAGVLLGDKGLQCSLLLRPVLHEDGLPGENDALIRGGDFFGDDPGADNGGKTALGIALQALDFIAVGSGVKIDLVMDNDVVDGGGVGVSVVALDRQDSVVPSFQELQGLILWELAAGLVHFVFHACVLLADLIR